MLGSYYPEIGSILFTLIIYIIGGQFLREISFKKRLDDLLPPASNVRENVITLPGSFEKIQKWLASLLSGRLKESLLTSNKQKNKLKRAGEYSFMVHSYYKLIKLASGFLASFSLLLTIFLFFPGSDVYILSMACAVSFAFGYILVDVYYTKKGDRRIEEANRFFSDYLQLLIISLSAGLALEAALRRVSLQIKRQSIVLHQESEILLAELSLRGDRGKAFSHFGERLQSEYFRNLGVIMQQTEKQGVSSVAALKTLAHSQSQDRFSRIEARVGRLGVLMTIPLIVFVFPLLFGIIIVPSVLL